MGLSVLKLDHVGIRIGRSRKVSQAGMKNEVPAKVLQLVTFSSILSLFLGKNISLCGGKVNRQRLTRDKRGQLVTAQSGVFSLCIVVADSLEHGFQEKVNQSKARESSI